MDKESLSPSDDKSQTPEAKALAEAVEGALPSPEPKTPEELLAAETKAREAEANRAKNLQARVDRLTRERNEQKTRDAARIAELEAKAATVPSPDQAAQAEINRKAEELAGQKAQAIDFERETKKVLDAGNVAFPNDFVEKVRAVASAIISSPSDSEGQTRYRAVISGILETSEGDAGLAAKLLHSVGSDPDKAEELAKMSPVRLGKELTKMASQEPPAEVSKAPRPPSVVVGGRAPSHVAIDPSDPTRSDKLSTAEFMARRNAQVVELRKAGVRIR